MNGAITVRGPGMRARHGLPSAMATGNRAKRARVSVAFAMMLAGCAALPQPAQERPGLHLLQTAPMSAKAAQRSALVLEVAAPRAWPGFDTARIAYVDRPYAVEYFARSEWADAPARMLGPLLARALDDSGGFRAVVQAPTTVHADVRVETELVRLQQDFTTKPSRADLALRVQLVDAGARRVIATLVVEEREPAASDDAYGGVAAMNAALGRALDRAVGFVLGESGKARTAGP